MLNELQKYIQPLKQINKNTRLAVIFIIIATLFALLIDFGPPASRSKSETTNELSADIDTFIPKGFSLVPIEVINSSGLDSILGRFGMADLFLENKSSPVISNVRLVRGRESDSWAALVPSQYAQDLLSAGGRFLVSVRSRNNHTLQLQKNPAQKRSISYDN